MIDVKGKISIIMPAHNEAKRILSNVEETARTFNEFGCNWEIILIDDGSEDNTYEVAASLVAKYPGKLIVKKNPINLGKGRAIKKALHYVSGDYVLFLDADLDLHPIQFRTLFDIMYLNNADVVIGSKLHPNSVVIYPWHRRIICLVYYWLVKLLFGLPCRDTQTGLKLLKTDVLRKVLPRLLVRKFAFDIELLVNIARLGYKIVDAPLAYLPQKRFGWISLKAIARTGLDTLAVFIRARVLKYYDRINYYRRKKLAKVLRRMRRQV